MITLFIDTSLSNLTIGIVKDGELLGYKNIKLDNELSIYAISYLDEIFKEVNLDIKNIDKIMVTNGPGSYTGVRVGVTIAKTIAWALEKEIVPISSLKALAISTDNSDFIVAVLDARRDCYFGAIYDKSYTDVITEQYISKDKLITSLTSLIGNIKIVSDRELMIEDIRAEKIDLNILKIVSFYSSYEGLNPHQVNPNYLKDTEAEENLK
jgi:tRNA threonylcarbamoyladenosine biosynthesis protein TsaB